MVGRREFAGTIGVALYSLVRIFFVLTGLQWTRAGRKLYR